MDIANRTSASHAPLLVRVAVAAALAGTGVVHLLLAGPLVQGVPLIGVSFVVGGVGALGAAVWLLLSGHDRAWDLAAALCAGMLLALAAAMTVGLFGFQTAGVSPEVVVAVVTELAVVVAWVAQRAVTARH